MTILQASPALHAASMIGRSDFDPESVTFDSDSEIESFEVKLSNYRRATINLGSNIVSILNIDDKTYSIYLYDPTRRSVPLTFDTADAAMTVRWANEVQELLDAAERGCYLGLLKQNGLRSGKSVFVPHTPDPKVLFETLPAYADVTVTFRSEDRNSSGQREIRQVSGVLRGRPDLLGERRITATFEFFVKADDVLFVNVNSEKQVTAADTLYDNYIADNTDQES